MFAYKGKHDRDLYGFGPLLGNVKSFLGHTWKSSRLSELCQKCSHAAKQRVIAKFILNETT